MSQPLPNGFRFAGVHCGVKQDATKRDLTLLLADRPAVAAGVYTKNIVHAASVARNRGITPTYQCRAIVINSGNANTCTGRRGHEDNARMAALAADACGVQPQEVLVMSTGIIGQYLPMEKIAAGIRTAAQQLEGNEQAFLSAAHGMLTTDKSHKVAHRSLAFDDRRVQVAGMAKGAGMIGPNMATMLAVVLTDASLSPDDAQAALTAAVNESFNCTSVEGHTSTSDSAVLLAGGAAGGEPLAGDRLSTFQQVLTDVCIELARMIADDGEGASHLIHIQVQGCRTREDARRIAQTIANSALVKTGIAGADPNWGRIVSAAGYAGVEFNPDRLDLKLNDTMVFQQGAPVDFDEAALSRSIRDQRESYITLQFSEGDAGAQFWTSDLTVDYVKFNSDYHT